MRNALLILVGIVIVVLIGARFASHGRSEPKTMKTYEKIIIKR